MICNCKIAVFRIQRLRIMKERNESLDLNELSGENEERQICRYVVFRKL